MILYKVYHPNKKTELHKDYYEVPYTGFTIGGTRVESTEDFSSERLRTLHFWTVRVYSGKVNKNGGRMTDGTGYTLCGYSLSDVRKAASHMLTQFNQNELVFVRVR